MVAHIPKGACNLNITQIRRSPNYLGKQVLDKYYVSSCKLYSQVEKNTLRQAGKWSLSSLLCLLQSFCEIFSVEYHPATAVVEASAASYRCEH